MRRATRILPFLLIGIGLLVSPVRADVLVLRGGGRLTGTIESETPDSVTIRMEAGSMSVSRDRIERIERDSGGPAAPEPTGSDVGGPPRSTGEDRVDGALELTKAIDDGLVSAKALGDGFARISLRLRCAAPDGAVLFVAPGTYFSWKREKTLGGAATRQDMISTAGVNVRVPGGDEIEAVVPAAGVDIAKRVPRAGDRFAILRSPPSVPLRRMADALARTDEDPLTKQAAVWIVANDADYGEMWHFVKRTGGEDPRLLDYPVIRGMQLCEAIGIHLKTKRIWADSFQLVSALEPVGGDPRLSALEPWILEKLREMGYSGRTSEEVVTNAIATATDINLIACACRTAGRGGYRSATKPIKALLDRKLDPALLKIAAKALSEIADESGGPAAGGAKRPVDACLENLSSDSRSTRYRAVRTLTGLSPRLHLAEDRRRAVEALIPMLHREDQAMVALLTRSLVAYKDSLIPSDVIPATAVERVAVRRAGTTALATLTHPAASNRLADLLQDVDPEVRRIAKKALEGRRDAVSRLRALVRVPDPRLRRDLLDLVLMLEGPEVELALMEQLGVAPPEDRMRIITRYGEFGTPASVAAVSRALNDPEAEVRILAATTLGKSRDPYAKMALEAAHARETDPDVRKAIEAALR